MKSGSDYEHGIPINYDPMGWQLWQARFEHGAFIPKRGSVQTNFRPSRFQLTTMRKLKQGESVSPMAPLGNNFRPPQPLHQRVVRTNIDLYPIDGRPETEEDAEGGTGQQCPSMQAKKFYQGELVSARFRGTRPIDGLAVGGCNALHDCEYLMYVSPDVIPVSPEHLAVSSNFLNSR